MMSCLVKLAIILFVAVEPFTLNQANAFFNMLSMKKASLSLPAGNVAGSAANGGTGTYPWSNPDSGRVPNGTSAEVAGLSTGDTTEELRLSNYGFSIPGGATITGITVIVRRKSLSGSGVEDLTVELMKAGARVGSNLANIGSIWGSSLSNITYGNSSEMWGTTWTPAQVNAVNFGVAIQATYLPGSGNDWAYIDSVTVTIHYF